ncbi:5-methyltetrahydropteroyltriglutamate--homocysteine S-methyltransferase [Candidatus Carsonella ruddii PV]|uniref:5-methyltetrahydropteroyltriglutamate--homocysteine S-methyltransferase n=1 Tax=Carsonella ruddii (strain PV) TaxID=387662 RepID=Q05FW5_CARRP|nr:5-methyltetrahydropteroyltriglutamate--homocysteine S-methyltransferase [Candidatus Carsonella ruddii]BAF35056.1 5-methyltetrahydropteroyltriglutamate--homocysteine S-methyltransferase [Candidatus Carsonella ruddii PV]
MKIHLLGSPNIGKYRELKFITEKYWKIQNNINLLILKMEIKKIKMEKIYYQVNNNFNYIGFGDFTLYDNILDISCLINTINNNLDIVNIKKYFSIARGIDKLNISKMTKFFNTNYHYIVPKNFNNLKIVNNTLFKDIKNIIQLGLIPKLILFGPVSFLYLSNIKIDKLKQLLEIYLYILKKNLKLINLTIQIDEPILSLKLNNYWKKIFLFFYKNIQKLNFNLILTTYFEYINNLEILNDIKKCILHISPKYINLINNHNKSFGIINSNILKTNILEILKIKYKKNIFFSLVDNNKLLPYDISVEKNNLIKKFFSFFYQKITELKLIKNIYLKKINFLDILYLKNYSIFNEKIIVKKINKKNIKCKNTINKKLLNYTTIGSFPQNKEIRILRKFFKKNVLLKNEYKLIIKEYIYILVVKQISLELNLLVNGEFERTDMVEYFANSINGMYITNNGWIQSYGTRYVKPPIIVDIRNSFNITEDWLYFFKYIVSLPKKVILSGPITIIKWSYCINEKYKFIFCYKLSELLNSELIKLQLYGFKIFQIDEPTIKECLPINIKKWKLEINNFLYCFNNSTKNINKRNEIHTHICYSIFDNIINIIKKMNINVITIESTRENMNNLNNFKNINLNIGGGLYDVHSSIIPYKNDIKKRIIKHTKIINLNKIWFNPDCGLKTRNWYEIIFTLNIIKNVKKKILNYYS